MYREVFHGNSGIMDEKRAEKTDFYRESNSGSETGSPVPYVHLYGTQHLYIQYHQKDTYIHALMYDEHKIYF